MKPASQYSRTFKLTAVKECLYHPKLPSLRRMDMDTVLCKLPDEHSRLSTPCSSKSFRSTATSSRYIPPSAKPTVHFATELDVSFIEEEEEVIKTENDKNDSMNDSGIDLSGGEEDKEAEKGIRKTPYTNANGSSTYRYKLRQEPFVDMTGQSLTPANINGRHRSLVSSMGYNGISYQPWR